ncbi:hypothetical protein PGTUg99_016864 [Puccinia graminis f. sp. tritici]|uniref:Uncharacterized protein n=1 Tax=Puccinia graminis f. sp. tritici TaxID=56615 RepID=A0A5B0RI17_PUCGR|nr:hypothetical protein PGTUg99_016864 [Puccinia graminis f. sp. tritici]
MGSDVVVATTSLICIGVRSSRISPSERFGGTDCEWMITQDGLSKKSDGCEMEDKSGWRRRRGAHYIRREVHRLIELSERDHVGYLTVILGHRYRQSSVSQVGFSFQCRVLFIRM